MIENVNDYSTTYCSSTKCTNRMSCKRHLSQLLQLKKDVDNINIRFYEQNSIGFCPQYDGGYDNE